MLQHSPLDRLVRGQREVLTDIRHQLRVPGARVPEVETDAGFTTRVRPGRPFVAAVLIARIHERAEQLLRGSQGGGEGAPDGER